MDNFTVWIIIGNIGAILALFYLIRLSVFGSNDDRDERSSKQSRSTLLLGTNQNELISENENSSIVNSGESRKLKDGANENQTCDMDTNLRKRVLLDSKTSNQRIIGCQKNKESDLIQEEFINSVAVDEVEQSVNVEFERGTTARETFTTGVEDKASFDSTGSSVQKEQTLQQLSSFAGNFVNSVVLEAVGEIIEEENKEQFIDNLAKDILNRGIREVVTNVGTTEQERSKLYEYEKFSEQYSTEVLVEGIRLAASHRRDSSIHELLVENSLREGMQVACAAHQHAECLTSSVCKSAFEEATLSAELKPHICGVVQNLVNEAIYEAVLRVNAAKTPSCQISTEEYTSDVVCTTALESHVENSIHELISSAIDAASSDKDQAVAVVDDKLSCDRSEENEQQQEFTICGAVPNPNIVSDKIIKEKKQESLLFANGLSDTVKKEGSSMNGHLEHTELIFKADEIVPTLCSLVEQSPFDVVPDKNLSHFDDANSSNIEVTNKDVTSPTGFWRRSLIEDLENDIDLEESLTSSSDRSELESPKSDFNSPTPSPNKTVPMSSDDFSDDEFVDSEEDEIIDHAEEAKMGAVGVSHQPAASGDNIDTDDDDDDDDDYSDSDEAFEPFEAYLTVDGLCMSVHKERKGHSEPIGDKHKHKHKRKHKHKPRHRIKSAGQHFNKAVVIDNGCGVLKAGFAGERKPRVVEPAVIGVPKRYSLQMTGMNGKKDRKYGQAATNAAGVLHLDYPMKPGMIDSWTDIEDMWEYMLYSALGASEGDHPVLLTEIAHNPIRNREKVAEILFEHLSVPAMYLADQLSLALYSSGLTTGVSVSSGFSVTESAVVYEGHMLPYTAQQLDIAGQQLTENFRLLLRDNKGLNFVSSSEWQLVNTMKETLAYIAQDYSEEFNKYQTGATDPKYFTLPDGQMVEISSELISSVEPLFEPESLVSANDTVASQLPLPKMVTETINRCDVELQDMCNRSVVLSGGTTMLPGLVPRLQREMQKLNTKMKKIRAPDERRIASWIGGSILASLSTFESQFITIDEYAEYGTSIVRRKCF